jgi:hypothetical protein
MKHATIGPVSYRIVANEREGQWLAHAERAETGDRFGIECAGASEEEAETRLSRWLEWQHEHTVALQALQDAERTYHRSIAGGAFAALDEGSDATDMRNESLASVQSARARLDEIRAARPA